MTARLCYMKRLEELLSDKIAADPNGDESKHIRLELVLVKLEIDKLSKEEPMELKLPGDKLSVSREESKALRANLLGMINEDNSTVLSLNETIKVLCSQREAVKVRLRSHIETLNRLPG
jgi:hypothetical protein